MASFTERATLEVKDNSTAQIRKINAELKKLQATANSLKSIKIEIIGVSTAIKQVNNLTRALTRLKAVSSALKINVGTQGLSAAQRQITNLRTSARRPINVRMNYTGGRPPPLPPGGGGGGGGRGRGGGRRGGMTRNILGTALQGANAGAGGGMGFGLMGGLAAVNPAMLAVAAAAYAAAAALKFIGDAGAKADRADLMVRMAATPEQQGIINQAVAGYAASQHPMAMSKSDMKMFITGMLGDVGGSGATPEERARSRATAASAIAPIIADKFLPLAYALGGPDVTKESAIKDLNVVVKGLNIASGNLTNSLGQFTEDGKRVFEGVALAKAMNPQLDSDRIRTTLANLKTAAFTLTPESLARVLSMSGDRGVRAGNELYQAIRSMTGTVDNKALNKALSGMGLLEGGKPILTPGGKVKKGKSAGMQTGSQTPVDAEMLRTDPFGWFQKHVVPIAEKRATSKADIKAGEARAKKVQEEGGTPEEVEEAREPLRAKIQTILDQMFPGMPATSRTALSEAIFGEKQAKGQIEQGKEVMKQNAKDIFEKSWTAQLSNLRSTLESKAGDLGTSVADALGLSDKIKAIDDALKSGDYGALGKGMTAAQQGLELITSPQRLAGELLLKGAQKLWEVGVAIAQKLGLKETPPPTPEAVAAEAAAKAKADRERKVTETQVAIDRERRMNEERERRITRAKAAGVPETKIKPMRDALAAGRAEITTMSAQIGTFNIPQGWGVNKPEMFPSPLPTPKKGESVFPDPAKTGPTPTADLQKLFGDMKTTTASWVTTVQQGPSAFEKAFGTLNQKAMDAGTSLGNNANTGIKSGASDAGTVFGNSAVQTIKAGVSNLNINVNANVTGATNATADKGGGGAKPD
jgi:hypothetical protein